MRATTSVLALVLAVAAAACGGGGSEEVHDPAADQQQQQEQDAASSTMMVTARGFAFDPGELEVEPGAEVTVEFTNDDEAPHTLTSEDLDVDIRADPGASKTGSLTAPAPGSFEFACKIHPDMKGTVIAGEAAAETDTEDDGSSTSRDY